MKKLKQKLIDLLLGVRAPGEKLPEPTFTTTHVAPFLSQQQWIKYTQFGREWGMKTDWKEYQRQMD